MKAMRKRQKMLFFSCKLFWTQLGRGGNENPGIKQQSKARRLRTFKALCISMEGGKLHKSAY